MSKNKAKYKIELSENQLNVYKEALEFYSRFLSGQVDNIPDVLHFEKNIDYYKMKEVTDKLKSIIFPELSFNSYYGIGYSKEDKKQQYRQISYEMYREVYVRQQKEYKNKNINTTYNIYDEPTLHYSNEPLPEIKEI